MLKILQARLQQYMNLNFQMFKLDLEKAEEPEIKLPTATAFDCVDHNKLENSSRDGNTKLPYLPPEKSVCRSRSKS